MISGSSITYVCLIYGPYDGATIPKPAAPSIVCPFGESFFQYDEVPGEDAYKLSKWAPKRGAKLVSYAEEVRS